MIWLDNYRVNRGQNYRKSDTGNFRNVFLLLRNLKKNLKIEMGHLWPLFGILKNRVKWQSDLA